MRNPRRDGQANGSHPVKLAYIIIRLPNGRNAGSLAFEDENGKLIPLPMQQWAKLECWHDELPQITVRFVVDGTHLRLEPTPREA